ncbi:MAG: hypothetical protein JWO95_533 [Verrucomicrobiales bacterium]|nr:hypothetical protein [Verrucomicrobiales bacterium]
MLAFYHDLPGAGCQGQGGAERFQRPLLESKGRQLNPQRSDN